MVVQTGDIPDGPSGGLSCNQEHHPAENDGRSGKQRKAVGAVADHALWSFALGDAEDYGRKQGKEQNRRKVGHAFLPVRMLCASTAAITLSKPETTMKRVPQSAVVTIT